MLRIVLHCGATQSAATRTRPSLDGHATLSCNAANKLLSQLAKEYPITLFDMKEWVINLVLRPSTCLDLFRGESGERPTVPTPYIFVDGSMSSQGVEVMKAFLDVAAENPQIIINNKARCNSCGFIKHQLRVCCNNSFDPSSLKEDNVGEIWSRDFVMEHLVQRTVSSDSRNKVSKYNLRLFNDSKGQFLTTREQFKLWGPYF
eukprot:5109970-Amphidinium_carterae.1